MARRIDGNQLAQERMHALLATVSKLPVRPGMAAILVGDNPSSSIYVRIKERRCAELGIHFEKFLYPDGTREDVITEKIAQLNSRTDIHAILLQIPLPKGYDTERVIGMIDPRKDVDGFHPENVERFINDEPPYIKPVLIKATLALIEATGVPLHRKRAVILGKSDVFMRPLGSALLRQGMQVVWQTVQQNSWCEHARQADVLITALGMPHYVTKTCVKPGAVVIDVGITKKDNAIMGDVARDVHDVASWITPVPGGVGPMTVAMLLENVVELAQDNHLGL